MDGQGMSALGDTQCTHTRILALVSVSEEILNNFDQSENVRFVTT